MNSLRNIPRLTGKVAIVTGTSCKKWGLWFHLACVFPVSDSWVGGGSGYGEGIAKRFAQEGAKVLITDLNNQGGKRVAETYQDSISFLKADVAQQEDWRKVIETAKSRYGRLDCLVNNAGVTYHNKVSDNPERWSLNWRSGSIAHIFCDRRGLR